MCGIEFKGIFAYIADCLMPNFFTLSFSFSYRLEFLFQHSLMFLSILCLFFTILTIRWFYGLFLYPYFGDSMPSAFIFSGNNLKHFILF